MADLAWVLNEHSVPEDMTHIEAWADQLLRTFRESKQVQAQFKHIRVSHAFMAQLPVYLPRLDRNVRSLLLKLLLAPYVTPEEEDIHEVRIIRSYAHFERPAEIQNTHAGLYAWLLGFPLLSADQHPWQVCQIQGHVSDETPSGPAETAEWRNASQPAHIRQCHEDYLTRLAPAQLQPSELAPPEKPIDTGRHHGSDMLMDMARKLVQNPFVEGIIGSGEFEPQARKFCHKIYRQGTHTWMIKGVLHRTDAGYSMLIRTTARSQYEAEVIAGMLEALY